MPENQPNNHKMKKKNTFVSTISDPQKQLCLSCFELVTIGFHANKLPLWLISSELLLFWGVQALIAACNLRMTTAELIQTAID